MNKLFLGLLFASTLAQAADMNCVETAKSKKEFGNDDTIVINVAKDKKTMWIMVKPEGKGKAITAIANRDEHNSLKDKDSQDTYNLDEDYDRKEEARFVTSESKISGSDADSIIFVEKSIFKGKPGKIALSSGQANDGEAGDAWLWSRNGEYSCK